MLNSSIPPFAESPVRQLRLIGIRGTNALITHMTDYSYNLSMAVCAGSVVHKALEYGYEDRRRCALPSLGDKVIKIKAKSDPIIASGLLEYRNPTQIKECSTSDRCL